MVERCIRQLPAQTERVETGAVQFGDDWPGLFIRGDNTIPLKLAIDLAFQLIGSSDPDVRVMLGPLARLGRDISVNVLGKENDNGKD